MKCPDAEDWDLLAVEALQGEQAESMLAHARICRTCRAQLEAARRDHIDRVRMYEAFDRGHDMLREQLMAALPDEVPRRFGADRLVRGWARLGGYVMSLNTTTGRRAAAALASAACILIAAGIFLTPGKSGVAFAAVLERMRQARTMVCDTVMTMRTEFSEAVAKEMERTQQEEGATPVPTEETMRCKLSLYSDGMTQVWRSDQADPASTEWTFPDHSVKIDAEGKRTVIRFAEQPNPYARCESPEWWLSRLLKLTEAPDRELGTETLDGREVVGFEIAGWKLGFGARPTPGVDATTAPTAVVRLWVDVSTRLPARMHVEDFMMMRLSGICSMRASMTWDHIEWDVPLDPQSFEPPPPVAGESVEQRESPGIPVPTEEALLDGLRAYAERIKALFGAGVEDHLPQLMEQGWPDDPEAAQARAVLGDILEGLGHGYPQQLDGSSLASSMLKLSIVAPNLQRGCELAARARGDAEALARWAEEREAAAGNAEAAARLAEKREAARKELHKKLDELAPSVSAMIRFYHQLLLEEREPEYFGATVKPGDSEAVLMRWKLDDSHWRVIYGDLRAQTVLIDQQPNGDVSLDSQSVQPPAPAASAPVQEEKLDTAVPTEEALLAGLRTYATAIERVKGLWGERLADMPKLVEQEWPDDPEAAQARAALSGMLEVLGHGYPQQLDQGAVLKASIILPSQVRANVIVARASGDGQVIARAEQEEERFHEEFADFPRTMQAMLVFYRQLLVEDREPDYFGATVKPGDSDAVLMRWKLDDGSLRVIYGDLRVETLPAEK